MISSAMVLRGLFAAVTAVGLVTGTSAMAGVDITMPPSGLRAFTVERDGSPIGAHRFRFIRDGERLIVESHVEVSVGFAFITFYRFDKVQRETWRGGRLVALETRMNNNGEIKRLSARANDGMLKVDGPEGTNTVPADIVPSGYWSAATVEQSRLLDSDDGTLLDISVGGGERDVIEAGGRSIAVRRYHITGDVDEKDVWYDRNGLLVRMRWEGPDGSTLEYVLDRCLLGRDGSMPCGRPTGSAAARHRQPVVQAACAPAERCP